MEIYPFYLSCLAHASYLLVDHRTKTAAVVDPQRDVSLYVEEAKKHGSSIKHVFLTHFHADFVSGHLELKELCGATIYLGARAKADYPFTPLRDGQRLEWGSLGIKVLETPGHTPEGVTLLVYDLDKDRENPKAALTGDTLFIGDVGRPDLMASVGYASDALAGMLYDSITHKLLTLPDQTLIYPAHGAGSMCGKALSDERVSTLGKQRRENYALKAKSREEFISLVTCDQQTAPSYFPINAKINRQEHSTLIKNMEQALKPLTLQMVLEHMRQGAIVLDTRTPADFSAAHMRGALNIGLGGSFASWAGSVLDLKKPIVIICDAGREEESIIRLARIGCDHVLGYLSGGMEALEKSPDLIAQAPRLTSNDLAEKIKKDKNFILLDVRTPAERENGFIEGSISIPLVLWPKHLKDVPLQKEIVVYCAGGYRSSIAASLLRANGYKNVSDLIGGYSAWSAERPDRLP